LDEKNYRQALEDFTSALSADNSNAMVWYNRGIAAKYLGDNSQACSDWRKALQLGETNAAEAISKFCK
jgi:Tfp pilus assembly protein PilF